MVKMLNPGFPSRRPGGFVRYILVAGIVLLLFYTFHGGEEPQLSYPDGKLTPDSKPYPGSTIDRLDEPVNPDVVMPGSGSGSSSSGSSKTGSSFSDTLAEEDDDEYGYDFQGTKSSGKSSSGSGTGSSSSSSKIGSDYKEDEDDAEVTSTTSATESSSTSEATDAPKSGSSSSSSSSSSKSSSSKTGSSNFNVDEDEDADSSSKTSGSKSSALDDEDDTSTSKSSKTGSSKKPFIDDEDEEYAYSYPNSKTGSSKSKTEGKSDDDTYSSSKSTSKTSGTSKTKPFEESEDDIYSSKSSSSKSKGDSSKSSAFTDYEEDSSSSSSSSKTSSSKTGSSKTDGSKSSTFNDYDEESSSSKSKTGSSKTGSSKPDGSETDLSSSKGSSSHAADDPDEGVHPIDKLIYDAQLTYAEIISKESKSLEEAAQQYRRRRGRHPPPGFDKWYEFASKNGAIIVEDFFDQIYHDLEPFWGMPPSTMRKESWDFEMTINIRDGKASAGSDWFWTQIWLNLISTIEEYLPDMDLALNAMDEPRLVVPWEDINSYMKKGAKSRGFPKAADVTTEFQNLSAPGKGDLDVETREKNWEKTSPYWSIARRGCAPDSEAREADMQKSFKNPPLINASNADPHSYQGFVSNFSMSNELCHQPDLQGLEGILIQPLSTSASKVLFPMFGGSKLTVNNEILLPAPMYWNEEERFTGGDDHGIEWKDKADKVIWRGVATGGKNTEDNWRGFQRHRFVAMNNGTKVGLVEAGKEEAENFALPEDSYHIEAAKDNALGEWIDEWADVSFIDLMCEPPQEDGNCRYTGHYFKQTLGLKMSEQFNNKYLPDIDGNSFSGRYLGFLRSTSVPIKAALWREWHDSRLVAWKHFVPMDSRFTDFYGIMQYFLGYNGKGGHDHVAEKIAAEGKEWAEKVLRKEDMQIYVLRLLLEYGRLLDDGRESLGWVEDALKDPSVEKTWANFV